jgi:hypothetical protein
VGAVGDVILIFDLLVMRVGEGFGLLADWILVKSCGGEVVFCLVVVRGV